MDIVVGNVGTIVKLALQIKKAADTVQQNRKDCGEIAKLVVQDSALLELLEERTEMTKDDAMRKVLDGLSESLEEALKLVTKCQEKHIIRRFIGAGDMASELRRVQEDIARKISQASLATGIHANILMTNHFQNTGAQAQALHATALNYSTANISSLPAPDKVPSSTAAGKGPLDVVIVYAFDCSTSTPAWYTVDDGVFWMVQEKLKHFTNSCLGYIYVMLSGNTYTCDMKPVDPDETKATGYTGFARRRMACTQNMASGLTEAHKMISNRGYQNGVILFFSDGLINKGHFFDGTENYISKVPVHTFTLGGDANNQCLLEIATNSPGGKFHTDPVPERPNLSPPFSKLLDIILGGREPLDVVIVYAFDCTNSTPAWYTVDGVFWMVQEKLTRYAGSCLGYIYVMSTPNTYTCDMKPVDSGETKATGYKTFAWRRTACTKNMASGLAEAHKMVGSRGYHNGIILFFSDGLINGGDFFDGTEDFISKVPVHTFTVGGDAYNHGLQAIAANSPGGRFNPGPVPEIPQLSISFSKLLDSFLDD
ncbi:unnamed protein product [Urochloa humidicola]